MSVPNVVFEIGYVNPEGYLNTDYLKTKYGNERRFYSCNQEFNYLKYINDGSKEKIDYIAYSGNSEKSSGVFTKDGLIDKPTQRALREKLRSTESVIWHGYISFQREFGQRYMSAAEDAISLMKAEMPVFLKSAWLDPNNVTWYAGLHENTSHRHIHYSFFEEQPTRYRARQPDNKLHFSRGVIPQKCIDRFKIRIEQRLTNISAELKISRNDILHLSRELLFTKANHNKNMQNLQDQMLELSERLPKTGSLSYNSENMSPLRPEIKRIVDILPKCSQSFYTAFNGYMKEAMRRDEATRQMLIAQGINKKYWPEYLTADMLLDDIYRRVGNKVINSLKYFRKKETAGKGKYVRKRLRKKSTLDILEHCTKLAADAEREAMDAFNEYLEKLDSNKEKEEEEYLEME